MKKYRVFLLVLAVASLGIVLSGCMNLTQPPQAPTYSYPSIGQTNVPVNPTLSWSDPGNNLTYDVYFGTSSNPPLVTSGLTATSYTPSNLAYSTTYYWKVVAKNSAGSTSGPIWSFTTQSKPAPSIPNVTGSWSLTVTQSGQSPVSGNVLLLQNQDNKSNVAMIQPLGLGSQSWYNGGFGFSGTIKGDQIALTCIINGQSATLQGTISNGAITGTVNYNGQSGTFQMTNMQPLTISPQNFNIIGNWQFTLNDQTSGNTFTFTTKIYQDGSDVVNVITSSTSFNGANLQGYAFFGALQGNSLKFNLGGTFQLTGTLLTNHSMSGNFTVESDTGTWSATFISSY